MFLLYTIFKLPILRPTSERVKADRVKKNILALNNHISRTAGVLKNFCSVEAALFKAFSHSSPPKNEGDVS